MLLGRLVAFLQIDEGHSAKFMQGSQQSKVQERSDENTFEEYFLMPFLLSFLNLMNYEGHDIDQVIVWECCFQPLPSHGLEYDHPSVQDSMQQQLLLISFHL